MAAKWTSVLRCTGLVLVFNALQTDVFADNEAAVSVYPPARAAVADVNGVPPPPDANNRDPLKNIAVGPYRLDIGGGIRFRFEHQRNFNAQRYADTREQGLRRDSFLLQRARLDFNLSLAEEARMYAELQDARAYNSDFHERDFFGNNPYWNDIDLRQAYLEWRHIDESPFGFKVGRQTISYGDNRIWGPGEWGNVGRYSWDAAKFIADLPLAETHFIFANRVRYEPHDWDRRDPRMNVYGIYSMVKNLPLKLDLFWLGKHTRPDMVVNAAGNRVDLATHTLGVHVDGKVRENWDYAGTLAHTLGRRNGTDVEAWGANARLGYTFDAPWQPRIGGEFSYGSGDHRPGRGDYETFDGAVGAVDILYYGRMNLFSWMNLQDYQLSFSLAPTQKLRLFADWHVFRLDCRKDAWYYANGQPQRTDPTGRSGSLVGQELDLMLRYEISRNWQVLTGYSHFFPGPFLRRTGSNPHADWFFLQLGYSF